MMPANLSNEERLHVAIIGGGITGVTLALGLFRRNISFAIYERALSFREVGAGIGFTSNAERAMKAIDPVIHKVFKNLSTQNVEDWFQWVDGYHHKSSDANDMDEKLIARLYLGERGFEGCRRQDFLENLVELLPEGRLKYGKYLDTVTERGDTERVLLKFHDGTVEEADVVVGCDGIRSRMRRLMFGIDNPASYPSYTHKVAFRGLIPMDSARAALGEYRASTRLMHLGPNAHVLTFPVAMGTVLNLVAFTTDPEEWEAPDGKFTAPATKTEAVKAFSAFGPAVRAIIGLLPDELDKWAIFDTFDHPVPTYVQSRLCLAGDAAHAAAPHHGAGAGFGIEDALVLATLMDMAGKHPSTNKAETVRTMLKAYNKARYERTQWLVHSSRMVGELFEWQDAHCGSDAENFRGEIEWRSHRIWDYDVEKMVTEACGHYLSKLDE